MADPDDILIVYGRHQARQYPQFKSSQVIPFLSLYLLKGWRPKRVFRTGLGVSDAAWRMLAELEAMAWKRGTELYRIEQYDEVMCK